MIIKQIDVLPSIKLDATFIKLPGNYLNEDFSLAMYICIKSS